MGALLDLTAQRFGRLLVVERGENRGCGVTWRCQCACGTEHVARAGHLRSGRTQSCGCLPLGPEHRARAAVRATKHGHAARGKRSPEYSSWSGMVGRCTNPRVDSYPDYGGRGITICDRWRFGEDGKYGFECFLADMGPRMDDHTLDRIEVNGNYDPVNCRWATRSEQNRNQRPYDRRRSEATKAKIGAIRRGRKLSPESIAKRTATRAANRAARITSGLPTVSAEGERSPASPQCAPKGAQHNRPSVLPFAGSC
jgi:hypothetical protein